MLKLIAHRGASAQAPENTLSAFRQALEIGVDAIELDVRLTQDGVPVIFHDAFINRTTNANLHKRIDQMTLQELHKLDAGSWFDKKYAGEKIPTLEDFFSLERGSTGLMIEIKEGRQPPKEMVASILQRVPQQPNISLGSFSLEIVDELLKQNTRHTIVGIIEKAAMTDAFMDRKLRRLVFWYKMIDPMLVQRLHGTEIWAFTVNTLRVAEFLKAIHIDGLITNHPHIIKTILNPI